MGIKQNSKIMICQGIKLDKNYKNVLSFTENEMVALCTEKKVASATNYSFIDYNRGEILVNFTYSQCLNSNYLAFQNPYYDNKWFFAFIDDVIYSSEYSTKIRYTIDVWSTFFDNWDASPCYVIREHVNDDTIGKHTINEGLNVGEVMVEPNNTTELFEIDGMDNCYVCVNCNFDPETSLGYWGTQIYTKGITGQEVYLFDLTQDGIDNLGHFIAIVNGLGHVTDLHEMYFLPKKLFPDGTLSTHTATKDVAGATIGSTYKKLRYDALHNQYNSVIETISVNKKHSFSDYTPKNKKLFCYPYNFIYATNNVGSNTIYKYEDFSDTTCDFWLEMALSVGGSMRLTPVGYKGKDINVDEGLVVAKYPTCGWSSDSFTNWLTQNAVNIGTSVISTASNLFTGNVLGATGNIASLIGDFRNASLLPETVSGSNTGDVNFSSSNMSPSLYRTRAKTEYLKQIDDYFTRFGYKVVENKVANITGRQNYNYVEIASGEHIGYGNIPSKYMDEINSICQNGVTIWHNHTNLGNFNVSNNIV